MRKHYPLHKELKGLSKMMPPLYKPLLPLLSMGMKIMFSCKSDAEVLVNKQKIAGYEGAKIPVYVIEPRSQSDEKLPCLVFFHGGGFVFRASKAHYQIAKEYAWRVHCKVVYADYRLLPKHAFPIPVVDCFAAYKWTLEQAENLAIDPKQIYMGGDRAYGICIAHRSGITERISPLLY